MHFERKSSTAYADVVRVETLMTDLGVTIYDLETIDHVRAILDEDGEAPFDLTEAQALALAGQTIDHNDLADEYEYLTSKQRDAVSDALESHRHDSEEARFRRAAQAAHDVYRAQCEEDTEEPPRTDEAFEEGAVWGRQHTDGRLTTHEP